MFFRPPWSSEKSDPCGRRRLNPEPNEAALVAAAQADPRAFTALYARYLGPIYRYCFARLGNREAAEDATSETFLKALGALRDYHDGVFAAWIFQIAHNVVVDLIRRQRPTTPLESAVDPCDPASPVEKLAIAIADTTTLRTAIGRLSDEQRTVIDLQLAGCSHQQIAEVLGKSAAAVKMLRFRALRQLRALLTTESEFAPREVPDA